MHLPDGQLVDRAAHGDRDAFTEIVRRYQSLLCSIAYGITDDWNPVKNWLRTPLWPRGNRWISFVSRIG